MDGLVLPGRLKRRCGFCAQAGIGFLHLDHSAVLKGDEQDAARRAAEDPVFQFRSVFGLAHFMFGAAQSQDHLILIHAAFGALLFDRFLDFRGETGRVEIRRGTLLEIEQRRQDLLHLLSFHGCERVVEFYGEVSARGGIRIASGDRAGIRVSASAHAYLDVIEEMAVLPEATIDLKQDGLLLDGDARDLNQVADAGGGPLSLADLGPLLLVEASIRLDDKGLFRARQKVFYGGVLGGESADEFDPVFGSKLFSGSGGKGCDEEESAPSANGASCRPTGILRM